MEQLNLPFEYNRICRQCGGRRTVYRAILPPLHLQVIDSQRLIPKLCDNKEEVICDKCFGCGLEVRNKKEALMIIRQDTRNFRDTTSFEEAVIEYLQSSNKLLYED